MVLKPFQSLTQAIARSLPARRVVAAEVFSWLLVFPDRREPMFHLVLPVPLLPLTYQRPALPLFLKLPRESQENMTARAPRIPVLPTEGGLRPLAAYAASPRERPFAERREPMLHPVSPVPLLP